MAPTPPIAVAVHRNSSSLAASAREPPLPLYFERDHRMRAAKSKHRACCSRMRQRSGANPPVERAPGPHRTPPATRAPLHATFFLRIFTFSCHAQRRRSPSRPRSPPARTRGPPPRRAARAPRPYTGLKPSSLSLLLLLHFKSFFESDRASPLFF